MIDRKRYLNKIVDYMNDGQIKVITGIRRCGKSTLLFELFYNYLLQQGVKEESVIKLQLDSRPYAKYRNPVLLAEYVANRMQHRKDKQYLFIDEIQYCYSVDDPDNPGYKITVYDVLNELKSYKNLDVYVTGSNSRMLSSDIGTQFRGRASQIRVYPLSFQELQQYLGGDIEKNLRQYMLYGGMPYLVNLKNDSQRREYLKSLFDEVYLKDILERFSLDKLDVLENVLDLLASSIGSLTNPTNIANTLTSVKHVKISAVTVAKYLKFVMDSFLISEVKRYDVKGKHYFDYPNKYYYVDIGLRNARINFRQQDLGYVMENIIYNELLARGYAVDVGVVRDRQNGSNLQIEIDFVANYGDRRVYIQSAYGLFNEDKLATELKSLVLAKDFFRKIIIRNDILESFEDENGIYHCRFCDFLLNEHILEYFQKR